MAELFALQAGQHVGLALQTVDLLFLVIDLSLLSFLVLHVIRRIPLLVGILKHGQMLLLSLLSGKRVLEDERLLPVLVVSIPAIAYLVFPDGMSCCGAICADEA